MANQPVLPTPGSVTPSAGARVAPLPSVADLCAFATNEAICIRSLIERWFASGQMSPVI